MILRFDNELEKSLAQDRFRRAGLGGVESSWKSVNEIRDVIGRYVKIGNIKLVNAITKAIDPDIEKSVELNLDAMLSESDDMLKAINPKKVKPTAPSLLKYEQGPPDPDTTNLHIRVRAAQGIRPEDFEKIDDVVFFYLNGNAQPAMIDAVTKAYRLGMKTGSMSEMKVPDKKIADMPLVDVDNWEGSTPFIKTLKKRGIADEYAFAAQWAKDNAMTSIAIYDENGQRAGKAYETIMRMFRDQVAYTLAHGEDVSKLRTRLIFPEKWTDVEGHQHDLADQLSPDELRQYTVAHLNRDWDRLAFDQIQRAFQAGRLTMWSASGFPVYAKFLRVRNRGKQCEHCKQWQGAKLRVFRSEAEFQQSPFYGGGDVVVGDPKAHIAAWPGKNNDDRAYRDHWVAAPAHPHCVSSDTEVLTSNGWKLFKDVQSGDRIFSINNVTREIEFVDFTAKIQYHHKGDMVHFSGYTFDQLVTREHRMPISERKRKKVKGKSTTIGEKRSIQMAESLLGKSEYSFPRTGVYNGIEYSERYGIIAELLGWYVAEGTKHTNEDAAYIIQFKKADVARIRELLDAIEISYSVHKQGIYIKNEFGKYLRESVPDHSPYRKVPEWIKSADKKTIQRFLDGYCSGDGSKRSTRYGSTEIVYHTSSPFLVSDITELIYKTGKYATFRLSSEKGSIQAHKNGMYSQNHDMIAVTECTSENSLFGKSVGKRAKTEVVQYDDMVYCLTLEKNGVMLIRRNGKSSWTGNCNDDYVMA